MKKESKKERKKERKRQMLKNNIEIMKKSIRWRRKLYSCHPIELCVQCIWDKQIVWIDESFPRGLSTVVDVELLRGEACEVELALTQRRLQTLEETHLHVVPVAVHRNLPLRRRGRRGGGEERRKWGEEEERRGGREGNDEEVRRIMGMEEREEKRRKKGMVEEMRKRRKWWGKERNEREWEKREEEEEEEKNKERVIDIHVCGICYFPSSCCWGK